MNTFEKIDLEIKKYKEEARTDFNILNEAYEEYEKNKGDDNEIQVLFDIIFDCKYKNNKIFFSPFVIEKIKNKIFINSTISNIILDNINELILFLNNHRFITKLEVKDNKNLLEVHLNYLNTGTKNSDKYEVDHNFDIINKDNIQVIINSVFQKGIYFIVSKLLSENKNNI